MGFDYINVHAEIPLFKAALESGKAFLGKMGSVAMGALEGAAQVVESSLAGIGNIGSSLGNISLARSEPVVEQAVKIEAPQVAQAVSPHHVDMAEMGQFSAPTFGSGPSGQGIGR